MTIEIRFTLPDGREEHVRSVETYIDDRFESDEQMRVGSAAAWRTNLRISGVRMDKTNSR